MLAYTFNAVRCLLGGIVLIPCVIFLNRSGKKNVEKSGSTEEKKVLDRPGDLLIGGLLCGFMMFVSHHSAASGNRLYDCGKGRFYYSSLYYYCADSGNLPQKKGRYENLDQRCHCSDRTVFALYEGQLFFKQRGLSDSYLFHLLCDSYYGDRDLRKKSAVQSCPVFSSSFAGVLSSVLMFAFEEPHWADIFADLAAHLLCRDFILRGSIHLQIIGQRGTDPTIASLILSLESVVSVLAGWIILGQTLTGREILGCVLMFGAIILAQINPKKKSQ